MISLYISLWIIGLGTLLIYAILKEREELGCYRISIAKQCDEQQSVYLRGTKMNTTDTESVLYERLLSILSYHEKGGVWRRCVILATVILIITYTFDKAFCDLQAKWIALFMLYFTVFYFFFNYINYHHFRNLKNNGTEIMEHLFKKSNGKIG